MRKLVVAFALIFCMILTARQGPSGDRQAVGSPSQPRKEAADATVT